MNSIRLIVGDWSKDGHNQSDSFMIKSNLTEKELKSAYKKGTKIIGFDLILESCSDYENNKLNTIECNKISKSGLSIQNTFDDGDTYIKNGTISIFMPEEWVNLYLYFCKTGNPNFEYEFDENPTSINIGGYGLYP